MRAELILGYILGSVAIFIPLFAQASTSVNWTFYAPGAAGWVQGGMTPASPDAGGMSIIHTLDDVRTGKSAYVTLASASSMKGRWYCIGTVTYTSPAGNGGDGQTHTLENVVGYVHDTGCAFNGTCKCTSLPQYCNGQAHPEKMDIALGNFTGWGALAAENYVTKNKNSAPAAWQQISGPPSGSQSASAAACGSPAKEDGAPAPATYIPAIKTDPGPATTGSPSTIGTPSQQNPQSSGNYFANPQSTPPSAPTITGTQPLLCAPQFSCSGNTVYFQSRSCTTQVYQACQYGCSGTVCAASSSAPASAGSNLLTPFLTTGAQPLLFPNTATSALDLIEAIANPFSPTSTEFATTTPIALNVGSEDIAQTTGPAPQQTSAGSSLENQTISDQGQSTFTSNDLAENISPSYQSASTVQDLLQHIQAVLLNVLQYLKSFGI